MTGIADTKNLIAENLDKAKLLNQKTNKIVENAEHFMNTATKARRELELQQTSLKWNNISKRLHEEQDRVERSFANQKRAIKTQLKPKQTIAGLTPNTEHQQTMCQQYYDAALQDLNDFCAELDHVELLITQGIITTQQHKTPKQIAGGLKKKAGGLKKKVNQKRKKMPTTTNEPNSEAETNTNTNTNAKDNLLEQLNVYYIKASEFSEELVTLAGRINNAFTEEKSQKSKKSRIETGSSEDDITENPEKPLLEGEKLKKQDEAKPKSKHAQPNKGNTNNNETSAGCCCFSFFKRNNRVNTSTTELATLETSNTLG